MARLTFFVPGRNTDALQAFLAGVSAAVVGVIAVVSVDWPAIVIGSIVFLLITVLRRDVAIANSAIALGIIYSVAGALSESGRQEHRQAIRVIFPAQRVASRGMEAAHTRQTAAGASAADKAPSSAICFPAFRC